MPDDYDNRSARTGRYVSDEEAEANPDTTVREKRDDAPQRLIVAAREANDAMRLWNRGGMKWLEVDGVFARLEAVLREVEASDEAPHGCGSADEPPVDLSPLGPEYDGDEGYPPDEAA